MWKCTRVLVCTLVPLFTSTPSGIDDSDMLGKFSRHEQTPFTSHWTTWAPTKPARIARLAPAPQPVPLSRPESVPAMNDDRSICSNLSLSRIDRLHLSPEPNERLQQLKARRDEIHALQEETHLALSALDGVRGSSVASLVSFSSVASSCTSTARGAQRGLNKPMAALSSVSPSLL